MGKIIHFTRHAQAEHNVAEDYDIRDAVLTPFGRRQAEVLFNETADLQQSADLLVSSPLKRTLQTAIIGYRGLRTRLEGQEPPKPLIVLSRLQEVNDLPCDTGSSRYELEQIDEFKGINFDSLEDDWNSKRGDFAANPDWVVAARARWVRRWLRDRPEENIVVVAHGDILRRITKAPYYEAWANAEVRRYTFTSEDDDEAELVVLPTGAASEARVGEREPTSGDLMEKSHR